MSWDVGTTTEPVARKEYSCDAAEWLTKIMSDDDFTADELVLFKIAKAEKFKILKGTKYIKTSGIWEGESSVFRARPELNAICVKYDLYEL